MDLAYREYCENLWNKWLNGTIEYSDFVRSEFQTDYLPEPYLQFGECENPLYVLTTNLGQGMPIQYIQNILSKKNIVSPKLTYSEISIELGKYYLEQLKGAARIRINSMIQLSKKAGFDGVLQVEACPFHSTRLPKNMNFLRFFVQIQF